MVVPVGDLANVVQLAGLDAVSIIRSIVKAANRARMHKRNCHQFANHLKLIGNLLEQIELSELRSNPATREALEQLEDALRRAYHLVHSCEHKSFLYIFAVGWNIVNEFKRSQQEIDFCLGIMPLVNLVQNNRIKESLEWIQRDHQEYKLDHEEEKVHVAVLKQEPTLADTVVLQQSLHRSYHCVPFEEALQKEIEKLHIELQQSQSDYEQRLIQNLLGRLDEHLKQYVAEAAHRVSSRPISSSNDTSSSDQCDKWKDEQNYKTKEEQYNEKNEWHADLLGCCSQPKLCICTFCYPCGTFSEIASFTGKKSISYLSVTQVPQSCSSESSVLKPKSLSASCDIAPEQACCEIMAYSLILSCCCYTCCVRRKLRKKLNIKGGSCDDFISHLLCCCCSLVQEMREVKNSGIKGSVSMKNTTTTAPSPQRMKL